MPARRHLGQRAERIHEALRDRLAGWALGSEVIPVTLAAATFLAFSPALLNGFVQWDDQANLIENVRYRGFGWQQIRWMFTTTLMGHYIPMTWLTFALDHVLWGMKPLGYHLTNNLLHAANAALFYLVALRVLGKATTLTGSALRWSGVMASLFFALHPLRAESVAWATERRDVLAGFFFLATVLLYLRAADVRAADVRDRRWLLGGSVACYVLAILSKSIVMTLPLVLILVDIYPLRRLSFRRGGWQSPSGRAALKEKVPYLMVGLGGAIAAYWAVASHHYLTDVAKFGWSGRLALAGYSLRFYLEKTLLPVSLSPLYELPAVVNVFEPRFLLSVGTVAGISVAALALHRRWPAGLAVWVYYGIMLGPVSGMVHAGHQLAHDRYSYLSCLGWALLVGAMVGSIARAAATGTARPSLTRLVGAAAAIWILALGTLTWHQTQVWRDTETLWSFAVESDPRCSICQNNLANSYHRRQLFALAKERYELALAVRPDRVRTRGNLALLLQSMGNSEAAMQQLDLLLAQDPDNPAVLANIGLILNDQGRYAEAVPYLERASRIDPDFVPGLVNLGHALCQLGQPEAALGHLLRARELRPDEPVVYRNLTWTYLALGQYGPARKAYEALVTLDAGLAREIAPAALRARVRPGAAPAALHSR